MRIRRDFPATPSPLVRRRTNRRRARLARHFAARSLETFHRYAQIARRDGDFIARIRVAASRSPSSRSRSPWTIARRVGSPHRRWRSRDVIRDIGAEYSRRRSRRTGANARDERWDMMEEGCMHRCATTRGRGCGRAGAGRGRIASMGFERADVDSAGFGCGGRGRCRRATDSFFVRAQSCYHAQTAHLNTK